MQTGDTNPALFLLATSPSPAHASGRGNQIVALARRRLRRRCRIICLRTSARPTRRVFGNADRSGADRTLDRAGAARERGSVRRKLSEKFSLYSFGAREVTIFSKRGSPRSGSQKGSSFRRRNSAPARQREHAVQFPIAAKLTPSRVPTPR